MYRKIDDFIQAWDYESKATSNLLGTLTDASLSKSASPDDRTIARTAWHIVKAISELAEQAGVKLSGPAQDAPAPKTAKEIRAAYDALAKALPEAVKASWNDDTLLVVDEIFGGYYKWPKGVTLHSLITHQAHHRGQLITLMRFAGLKPVGVYGPTREEEKAIHAEMQAQAK